MADKMQFDLVSPERKLASLEVDSVMIPGAEGDMVAMPNHAPVLTTLRPGYISATNGTEVTEYLVTGGFAEVSATGATVLAEQAIPKSEVTKEVLQEFLDKAKVELEAAAEHHQSELARRVAEHDELLIRHGA